jgi:hypothetical protein
MRAMNDNVKPRLNLIKLIFGIVLALPPIITSILFCLTLITRTNYLKAFENTPWSGDGYVENSGYGYMSALPIYMGLMAIAGAYLINKAFEK